MDIHAYVLVAMDVHVLVAKDIHAYVLVAIDIHVLVARTYFFLPNASRRYLTFTAVQTVSVSPFSHTPCRD